MINHALEYHALGWSIMPVSRKKIPLIKWKHLQDRQATEGEIRTWWKEWPNANIGVITGALSGIVVFDADDEKAHQFITAQGGMPASPQCATGKDFGTHFYFKHPGYRVKNDTNEELKLDVRGDGGFAMLPPSIPSAEIGGVLLTFPLLATTNVTKLSRFVKRIR